MIPCACPSAQYRTHRDAIQAAVMRVLDGETYILGSEVAAFETAFAAYCDPAQTLHAVGVNSGTDALILAMHALGIGTGDEVVTVAHTALATIAAVIAVGATPVLVDIDPLTYTLDPALLEPAITPRTKAVIAVHLYGQAADMAPITEICRRHGVAVIEDCAQAAGGMYQGKRIGCLADIACFSFYPTKNLGAIGDAGMVVAADGGLAERIRRLRQYGWDSARQTSAPGVNSRLDEVQAAILNVKLPFLDAENARRARHAAAYKEGLSSLPLGLPWVRPGTEHVYHLYVIACDERDALKRSLERAGIMAGIHYPVPAHRHLGYADKVRVPIRGLPVTDQVASRILSLPLYPELEEAQIEHVISSVDRHVRTSGKDSALGPRRDPS
jgi:dTDP-4-amino-4,6-dideoxygalactose transaminase